MNFCNPNTHLQVSRNCCVPEDWSDSESDSLLRLNLSDPGAESMSSEGGITGESTNVSGTGHIVI